MGGVSTNPSGVWKENMENTIWSREIPRSVHIERNLAGLSEKLSEYVKEVGWKLREAKKAWLFGSSSGYGFSSSTPSSEAVTKLIALISKNFHVYVTNMTNKLNKDRRNYEDLLKRNEFLEESIRTLKQDQAAEIKELKNELESLKLAQKSEKTTILEDFGQQTEASDDGKDDKSAENPDMVDTVEDEMVVEVSFQSAVTSGNKKDDSMVSKDSFGKTDACYDRFVEKIESVKECWEDLRRECKESKQQIEEYEGSLKYSEDHKKFLESQIEAHHLEMEAKNGVVKALEDRVKFLEQEMDKHTKKSARTLDKQHEN